MVVCPFGRRRRRPPPDRPQTTAPKKDFDQPTSRDAPADANAPRPRTSRKLSKRNSTRGRSSKRDADPEKAAEKDLIPPASPTSPAGVKVLQRPLAMGSREDITALPESRELKTSPHLRPVTQDNEGIPYNFRLQSSSSSVPAPRGGKLQRNPSGSKRAAVDLPLPRRKSAKKRKDDPVREEEIRAMSAPIPIPKFNRSSGLLRRDSKKTRGGLNRHFERPTSNVSLPLEESIHSSLSGQSEFRNYRVSIMDVVAPRPTLRYYPSAPYVSTGMSHNTWTAPSRPESERERRSAPGGHAIKVSRTVDSLADDLDAGALREIMDRDRRRRERKRKTDVEKLQRKLQRRAEKQRKKEMSEGEPTKAGADATPEAEARTEKRERVGLGIVSQANGETEYATQAAVDGPSRAGAPFDAEPSLRYGYSREEIPDMPTFDTRDEPESRPESPVEMQVDSQAPTKSLQPQKFAPAELSPPASPARVESGIATISVTGTETLSLPSSLPQSYTSFDPTPPPSAPRRGPEPKRGMFSSLFRRDQSRRKTSTDTGNSTPPSEPTFANVSREQMSPQPPPAHLHRPTQSRSRSGTPVRTQSRFREEFPDMPLSPPDSRVQSPGVGSTGGRAVGTQHHHSGPPNLHTDSSTQRSSNPFEDPAQVQTDSPVSGRGSNLVSRSLASIDSEGSWLSGRPMNRLSRSRIRHQSGTSSIARATEEFSNSHEDIHDDEYFTRFSPLPGEHRRGSALSNIIGHKASSSAIAPVSGASDSEEEAPSSPPPPRQQSEGETVVHIGPSRHAAVHHRDMHVKSSEGLLNRFNEPGDDPNTTPVPQQSRDAVDPPIDNDENPLLDEPEIPQPAVHRATSINLGKGHARTLSAGSVKLLEIPKRHSQQSTSGQGSNRGSSTMFPDPIETAD